MRRSRVAFAALAAVLAAEACRAQEASPRTLVDLTLEELSNLPVTSVSRRAEPLAAAPASVFVITSADIRRSGATSLPEALRLAPNLIVARRQRLGLRDYEQPRLSFDAGHQAPRDDRRAQHLHPAFRRGDGTRTT